MIRRALVLLVTLVLLAVPARAGAHVTVLPELADPGATREFTFRVPNERDDAATVQLDVVLPRGLAAEAEPLEGWTQARVGDALRWTASTGAEIRPGRTQDFKVRLGPLPDAPYLEFKSLQRYADGQVVRWIQPPGDDSPRPAAALDLGGGVPGTSATSDDGGGTGPALVVGAVAVLLALAGGGLLLLRRRR
jgi:periplasmic copper chaperone A